MTTRMATLAEVSFFIVMAGCTQLDVQVMPAGSIAGVPYALPRKAFLVAVEYELKECAAEYDTTAKGGRVPVFVISIQKTLTLTSAVSSDPQERYYIPYSNIRNPFKNVDATVTMYENGTLKGVTDTVEDKTGPAITAALGTALRLGSIATGVPLAADEAEVEGKKPHGETPLQKMRRQWCSAEAIRDLDKLAAIKKAAAAPKKKDPAKPAAVANSPAAAADAAPAKEANAAPAADAAAADDDWKTAGLRRQLTRKYSRQWIPSLQSYAAISIEPADALAAWLTADGLKEAKKSPDWAFNSLTVEFKPTFTIDPTAFAQKPADAGILVRLPMSGLLRVCEGTVCPEGDDVSHVLKAEEHVVPQLGPYVRLPLHSRIFENQTLTLEIAESGAITKLGYKSSATADAALSTLNTNLDSVMKAKAAQEKAKSDARTAALNAGKDAADKVTADNKAIVDCLKAQSDLRAASGTPLGTCQ